LRQRLTGGRSIMAAHEGDAAAAGRARELGELLLAQHGC
jgi:hypothetical protein